MVHLTSCTLKRSFKALKLQIQITPGVLTDRDAVMNIVLKPSTLYIEVGKISSHSFWFQASSISLYHVIEIKNPAHFISMATVLRKSNMVDEFKVIL